MVFELIQWGCKLIVPFFMIIVTANLFFLTSFLNPHLLLTFRINEIRTKNFARLWSFIGGLIAQDFPSPELDNIMNQHCHGDVLDVGPGSGFQLKRFRGAFVTNRIRTIYGVEPSTAMHAKLRENAVEEFQDKAESTYKILSCGAQPDQLIPTLHREGMNAGNGEGLFDTIVTFRVLCGIPQPKETASLFYQLLKPGGTLIFLEHVVNSGDASRGGSMIARMLQSAYMMLGWSFWNGGCELTRDTTKYLLDAAAADNGWEHSAIFDRYPDICTPEKYGYLRKKSRLLPDGGSGLLE